MNEVFNNMAQNQQNVKNPKKDALSGFNDKKNDNLEYIDKADP